MFSNEKGIKFFFSVYFAWNETLPKFQILTKTMDEPIWKNVNFVGFWNRCFHCSERLVCYIKRRKSFFHDLFSRSMTLEYKGLTRGYWGLLKATGVTRSYKGLQGVKKGYKGLQGVTRGDMGWQEVTGSDKGLKGVTKDYRKFFLIRAFAETFSWSILHKNESWRNLKFLTMTIKKF